MTSLLIWTGSVELIWPRLQHRAADLGAIGEGLETAYQAQVAAPDSPLAEHRAVWTVTGLSAIRVAIMRRALTRPGPPRSKRR